MKKIIKKTIMVIVIIVLLFVIGQVGKIIYTFENAAEIVDNSNLDYDLLSKMPKKNPAEDPTRIVEGFNFEKGFGCYSLRNDQTTYTVSGFPDSLSSYYVTRFNTTDEKYHVFGIKIGDNINESIKIMNDNGYSLKENYTFKRGIIIIKFLSANDLITEISIKIPSTNIFKVIF